LRRDAVTRNDETESREETEFDGLIRSCPDGGIQMASFRFNGDCRRARVRRAGYPVQTHSILTKKDAERWGRSVEVEIYRGPYEITNRLNQSKPFTNRNPPGNHNYSAVDPLTCVTGWFVEGG
jgi:hypothetical protein